MAIYVKNIFYFHISFFFWFSNVVLSDALILPVSQLETEQVMTSQNTSFLHSFAHFIVKIMKNLALMTVFNSI